MQRIDLVRLMLGSAYVADLKQMRQFCVAAGEILTGRPRPVSGRREPVLQRAGATSGRGLALAGGI